MTERRGNHDPALTVFAFLWGAAALFHLSARGGFGPREALLTLAALLVLCRPSSPRLLVGLAALQVYDVGVLSPAVSNHWLFTAFINVTILLAAADTLARRRALDAAALFRAFAPVARWELLALYGFVVLHKLNADYFSAAVSCGAVFYRAQAGTFPFLPVSPALEALSMYLTVIVEASIPLLLAVRRTRNAGIAAGALFHTAIAFNPISPFYNFSSMMLALFVLFTPPRFAIGLTEAWNRLGVPRTVIRGAVVAIAAVAGALLLARAITALPFFAVYSAGLIGVFATTWRLWPEALTPEPGALTVPAKAFLLVPVVLVVNGASPYLGLKTETSFAMFSNLRTEGGVTNHFFIPVTPQPFGYQRTLVPSAVAGDVVPVFERDREQGAVPYLEGKLLLFRPLRADGPQTCRH